MKHGAHPGDSAGRALLAGLARDFAPASLSGLRLLDEIECLAAVLLAIALCHRFEIRNVGWAAFSAYMVIRASFDDSLRRGCLRVLGTAAGVTLAWRLAPVLLPSPAALSAALALGGAVTLYLALLERTGYGWLFAGLSFAMVLVDGMQHAGKPLAAFAQARLIDVVVGTGASILVSALSTGTVRRYLPARAWKAAPAQHFCHKAALSHALQGALALALIPWVWTAFHIKALSQSSITIMVVMMVPMAELVAPGNPATTRLRHRLFGGAIGGLLATTVLLLGHGAPMVLALAVCVGLMMGRHVENGTLGISYAGTQFALAVLVVLVPDADAGPDFGSGISRLFGILLGMLLLEPVRLLFRRLARVQAPRHGLCR